MRELWNNQQLDPDLVLIHTEDEPVLLVTLFRAGVLMRPDPITGELKYVDSASGLDINRVSHLRNIVTNTMMPVHAKDTAERGILAMVIQTPWQIVGRLNNLRPAPLLA